MSGGGVTDGPFQPAAIRDPVGIHRALNEASFNAPGITQFLAQSPPETDHPLLARRARGGDPFRVAVRLFLLGSEVGGRELAGIFPADRIADLLAAGVLRRRGARFAATAQLAPTPDGELLVFSDFPHPRAGLAADHVLGFGPASRILAALTPRRVFARALDLGCGAGAQALLAAPHCGRVTGTDLSPRALNFAAANARLNGVDHVEWLAGDFFAPVADRRFDIIVANLPFVISPENQFIFRTGAAVGDGVSERVAREASAHLEEGGLAVILINWTHRADEGANEWAARPLAWTEGNGCDNWLLRFRSDEPLVYAAEWLRGERSSPSVRRRALDAWLEYYRRLDIGRISAGALVLRRRSSGPPRWSRCDALSAARQSGHCGAHLERVIAAETWARATHDDNAVLAQSFRLHPDHLLETSLTARPDGGGWSHGSLTLRPHPGLAFSGEIDANLMQVLGALDGQKSLGAVVAACAASQGFDAAGIAGPCAAAARQLLRAGLLVPTPD